MSDEDSSVNFMALCNDVIPHLDYTNMLSGIKRSDIKYEGESPDEVELAAAVKDCISQTGIIESSSAGG